MKLPEFMFHYSYGSIDSGLRTDEVGSAMRIYYERVCIIIVTRM
jgi:hypothetical protein